MQCVYPSKKKTKRHGIHDLERRNGGREETERGKKEASFLPYRKSHHPLLFFIKQVALQGPNWLPQSITGVLQTVVGH